MRPIDADALLRRLPDDLPYKSSVKRVLIQAPTLDVVPREEVEDLQRRYDLAVAEREANAKALIDANIDLEAMRGAANSYKMHYENLAREIFEKVTVSELQKCPVCDGRGFVRGNFYDVAGETCSFGDYAKRQRSSATCIYCNGKGIIEYTEDKS